MNILKKISSIFIAAVTLLFFGVIAFAGPLDEIEKETATDWSWAIDVLAPGLKIVGVIIGIGGIIIIVLSVVLLIKWVIQGYFGKKGLTKDRLQLLGIGVITSLVLIGSGWVGIFKFVDKVIVAPSKKIIDDQTFNQQHKEIEEHIKDILYRVG